MSLETNLKVYLLVSEVKSNQKYIYVALQSDHFVPAKDAILIVKSIKCYVIGLANSRTIIRCNC